MSNATVFFNRKPSIIGTATIAGPKEIEGNIGKYIDKPVYDDTLGEKTYEKAECKMLTYAIENAIKNCGY